MKIPGTKLHTTQVCLNYDFLELGDMIEVIEGEEWVLVKKDIKSTSAFELRLSPKDEVENAIQHFKFLRKYGLS